MGEGEQSVQAIQFRPPERRAVHDAVAVEEPLELRLAQPHGPLTLAVLMRTPGQDQELLLGWLLSEGLRPAQFDLMPDPDNANLWHLHTPEYQRLAQGARLSVSSSACGVCGTGSIERLTLRAGVQSSGEPHVNAAWIAALPARLLAAQAGFARTGGLHAAGLFRAGGDLLCAREDVGRHNAVDKVVGANWQGAALADQVLCVSSRAGFETVQKAVVAGVPVVVAVGAPTTLAIETAQAFGLTLCAFAREGRFTVYSAPERIPGTG